MDVYTVKTTDYFISFCSWIYAKKDDIWTFSLTEFFPICLEIRLVKLRWEQNKEGDMSWLI
jgi:hypothetical protein